MIKIKKPKFWDEKEISLFSRLLFPLSLIVSIFVFLKKNFLKKNKFKIPIICVGNIYIGGTGKTPASIFIANLLSDYGIKSAILRKYYPDHIDEFKLIKKKFTNLIINKKRQAGIYEAIKQGYETIILDDGLQEYKIKKDLKIVCFNENQLIGNGLIIPSGPLRESLSSLKDVDLVLINGKRNSNFENKILKINNKLKIYYSSYKPLNIHLFKNYKLLALAGIANPENFFALLKKNNLNVVEKLIFPDHYRFTKNEIQIIIDRAKKNMLKIIMTEKDYYKISDLKINLDEVNFLKISLEIPEREKLMNDIKKIYV